MKTVTKAILGSVALFGAWKFYQVYTTVKNITFLFKNFQVHKVTKNGIVFHLTIKADNSTGNMDVNVKGGRFKFYLNDSYVTTVKLEDKVTLAAGTSETVDFYIDLGWTQLGGTILDYIQDGGTFKVSMNGTLNVSGINVAVPKFDLTNVNVSDYVSDVVTLVKNIFSKKTTTETTNE